MKIGFCLPTNKRDALWDYFASPSSLDALAALLQAHECSIAIVAQPPALDDLASRLSLAERLRRFGFIGSIAIIDAPQETPPSMFRLRQRAFTALADSDLYFMADDNLVFTQGTPKFPRSSGERYLDVVRYMTAFPRCGAVQCDGTFGGARAGQTIAAVPSHFLSTSRGIIFRNAFAGDVFSSEQLKLTGGFEDALIGLNLLERGLWIAKQFNNPTQHKEKKPVVYGPTRHTAVDFELHDLKHSDSNFFAYVVARYGQAFPRHVAADGTVSFGRCILPAVTERYLAAGGDVNLATKRMEVRQ